MGWAPWLVLCLLATTRCGVVDTSWDSSIGHHHPWLGVVMKHTHCVSLSDTQLHMLQAWANPKVLQHMAGGTQWNSAPCLGRGTTGTGNGRGAPLPVQPQNRQWGDGALNTDSLSHPGKPLLLQSSSALDLAPAPSLNTKVSKLNSDCEYLSLTSRVHAEKTLMIQL